MRNHTPREVPMATSDDDSSSPAYARSTHGRDDADDASLGAADGVAGGGVVDEDVGWAWERDLESQGHGGVWERSRLEAGFDDVEDGGLARRGPLTCRRSDVRIYEDVCDLLTDHPALDASALVVEVTDCVVVLRGSVCSEEELGACHDVLGAVRGVASYELHVHVVPPRAGRADEGEGESAGDAADAAQDDLGARHGPGR